MKPVVIIKNRKHHTMYSHDLSRYVFLRDIQWLKDTSRPYQVIEKESGRDVTAIIDQQLMLKKVKEQSRAL